MKKTLALSVVALSLTLGAPALAADTAPCLDETQQVLTDSTGEAIAPGSVSPTGTYTLPQCEIDTEEVPLFVEPEESTSKEDREMYKAAFFAENYEKYETLYNDEGAGWAYLLFPGDFGQLDGSPMTPDEFSVSFLAHMEATSVYKDSYDNQSNNDSETLTEDEKNVDHDYNFQVADEVASSDDDKTVYDKPVSIAAGLEDEGFDASVEPGEASGGTVEKDGFEVPEGQDPEKADTFFPAMTPGSSSGGSTDAEVDVPEGQTPERVATESNAPGFQMVLVAGILAVFAGIGSLLAFGRVGKK